MSNTEQDQQVHVSCESCLKEIPLSEARREEASDYVLYFCGLECYRLWRDRAMKDQPDS